MPTFNMSDTQRFISSIFLIVTMAWLTGCSTLPTTPDDPFDGHFEGYDGCKETPPLNIQQACHEKNGSMQKAGMLGCYMCVVSYKDAGKTCQDSSDCQGDCRAKQSDFFPVDSTNKTGVCAKSNNPFGCYQKIENGVPQSALCVD